MVPPAGACAAKREQVGLGQHFEKVLAFQSLDFRKQSDVRAQGKDVDCRTKGRASQPCAGGR
jgi:hypothetical protein